MARSKQVTKAAIPYDDSDLANVGSAMDEPERFKMGEIGYSGLNVFNGVTKEEIRSELSWPNSIKTYKTMSYHAAIAAPLTLYENIIGKSDFKFIPPEKATQEELDQTRIMQEMIDDLDKPFQEVIREILTMNVYGFSVHEKVFRKRLKSEGSMYDDGLIGLKKIAYRNQESIEKFIFSDDGNEIIGVKQNLTQVYDQYNRYSNRTEKEVILPRSKFMLFVCGRDKGSPFGVSLLRDAYLSWRYLSAVEELESLLISKDLSGVPVMRIPAQYMASDASPEQKALYETFKNIIRNIQNNQQSGLILPSAVDPETRVKLFDFELLAMDGKRGFDTSKVKEYYRNAIYTALFADILILGQGNTGSFALGQVKNSLTGSMAEAMLRRIVDEFNQDLVKQVYELNGWNPARRCKLDFDNLETVDLESFSKAIQRSASVGFLPKTVGVVNRILESVGIDKLDNNLTTEELSELLSDNTSRAGDGMATAGDGTSTNGKNIDSNDFNAENAG